MAKKKVNALPGDIRCYKASVIAEKLGCSLKEARAFKQGKKVKAEGEVNDGDK